MIVVEKLFEAMCEEEQEVALREESPILKDWEYAVDAGEEGITTHTAQELLDSSRKVLCAEVKEQRHGLAHRIKDAIYGVDPMMAHAMVPECFYRGGMCPYQNPKGCNHNLVYLKELISTVPEKFYRDTRNEKAQKESGVLEGGDI